MRRRRAFTLIETLVVMSIIAILAACLLPAFLGARGAARRISCVNNLKQINLAIHGYLTAHSVLPSGSYDTGGPIASTPDAQAASWIVSLLPYMEQTALSHAFDPAYGANDPVNHTVAMARLSSLTCPTERPPGGAWFFAGAAPLGANGGPFSSYAGCQNDVEAPIDVDNHGVFYLNSRVRVVDVSDGLAQTLFVGELVRSSSLGWVSGTRSTLRNTGSPLNGLDRKMIEDAAGPPPLPADLTAIEFERMIAAGEHKIAPGFVGGFGSQHPGGANFAFGDGSVRFLAQTIEQTVFQRLGNRADGEPIDDEAY
jgi:prepilin-type N-terminal cleavage/methylation domain-containing protein/prepilin-type processing-associated H-X9-DG protein